MRLRVKPTKKQSRQDMILRLIKERQIKTQEELSRALEEFKFEVTQSSLSRDISELGLLKQHGYYAIPLRHVHGGTPLVTSIDSAGANLIVVKTLIGMAAPVGINIDSVRTPEIVGTVAGDDTVFVAVAPGVSHEHVKKIILKIFKGE